MRCPHCAIHFHDNWRAAPLQHGHNQNTGWLYQTAHCPDCGKYIFAVASSNQGPKTIWAQFFPIASTRGPTPREVPANIACDYEEACSVLPLSAKASAALSRRCLQTIRNASGVVGTDLQ
jgi:hypothetical protein